MKAKLDFDKLMW